MLSIEMTVKNKAESIFEEFCNSNNIPWYKIPEGAESTPDYKILLSGQTVWVEVQQIDKDAAFNTANGISSRTVGSHMRKKIEGSRKQIQAGSKNDAPSILLVFNNLDPFQLFGTETHDFISAMYGEMTVVLKDGKVSDSYHGRNASFRVNNNTSFSAVGLLRQSQERPQFDCMKMSSPRLPSTSHHFPTAWRLSGLRYRDRFTATTLCSKSAKCSALQKESVSLFNNKNSPSYRVQYFPIKKADPQAKVGFSILAPVTGLEPEKNPPPPL